MKNDIVTAQGWARWGKTSAHCIEPFDVVRLGRNLTAYQVKRIEMLPAVGEVIFHMDGGAAFTFGDFDEIEYQIKPKTYEFNDEAIYSHEGRDEPKYPEKESIEETLRKRAELTRTNDRLYMVTMAGKPMACGSLADCWRYVKEAVGDQRVSALMEMNITVEPAPATMKPGLVAA